MLIFLWFWYSFGGLCWFCVRFGPLYVVGADDVGEMLKTQYVFDGFGRGCWFCGRNRAVCGAGAADFGEMLKTHWFFSIFDKTVGCVVV